jgi:PGF-pre-PGF domain-containing protein
MKTRCFLFIMCFLFCAAAGPASAVTGTDWSAGTLQAGFTARSEHTSVAFNERMWIIGGTNGLTLRNDTWSSADGVTWTLVNGSAGFPARSDATSVVFNNRMWVIGGSDSAGAMNDTWSSLDGNVWTLANASAKFPARSMHTSAVFNDRLWVIGGWTTAVTNDTWSSSDGNIWTQANASAEFPARDRHATVTFDNSLWTVGGYDGAYWNDSWKSADGNIWTRVNASAEFPARSDHTTTLFDSRLWLIGGQNLGGMRNDTWYSTNGNTWTLANASPAFPARNAHTAVVLGNRMWLLGGADASVYFNDTWYTDATPAPVPAPQPNPDSDSRNTPVQSSVKKVTSAGQPVTFIFGNALSGTNPVRIESVTVIPAPSFSGEILCLVKDASRNNQAVPAGHNVAGLAEIDLVWIRDDAIREGTVTFSVDRTWLEGQKVTPADIVLLRSSGGTWQELRTSFDRGTSGRYYFSAALPGFSLFAVAAKPLNQTLREVTPSPSPTGVGLPAAAIAPVASPSQAPNPAMTRPGFSPTATAVPAPAGQVTDGGRVIDLIFVLVIGILLGITMYLVRRWWIRRQNPALFRK